MNQSHTFKCILWADWPLWIYLVTPVCMCVLQKGFMRRDFEDMV